MLVINTPDPPHTSSGIAARHIALMAESLSLLLLSPRLRLSSSPFSFPSPCPLASLIPARTPASTPSGTPSSLCSLSRRNCACLVLSQKVILKLLLRVVYETPLPQGEITHIPGHGTSCHLWNASTNGRDYFIPGHGTFCHLWNTPPKKNLTNPRGI